MRYYANIIKVYLTRLINKIKDQPKFHTPYLMNSEALSYSILLLYF